ncbi:AlpA family transcriptional regulator [Shewanella sp. WE21]|jgi:prophage regulatory protein|uniref:helix-turn-helix transcriptional regulator n=1 Tax=Shewanella sp. WE21 TaxID=2029986 RepID=UPI000D22CC16|nr:AlpA family phage regulatory protein [Shewanella sp. WE21]AVI64731.1 AlpA family transcriptional regulator [Shewanella sp. WE21]
MTQTNQLQPLISYKQMEVLTGKNRKTLWKWWAKDRSFPRPLMKGGIAKGWLPEQYQQWLESMEADTHE